MSDAPLTAFLCPRRLFSIFLHLLQKHGTACKLLWLLSYALAPRWLLSFFLHLLQKHGTAVKFNYVRCRLLSCALPDILAFSCTSCKNTPMRAGQCSMEWQLCNSVKCNIETVHQRTVFLAVHRSYGCLQIYHPVFLHHPRHWPSWWCWNFRWGGWHLFTNLSHLCYDM